MDFTNVTTLVSTVGFPIVCVFFMWKFINETMKEFTKAIQENTQMLIRINAKMDREEGKSNDQ